MSGALAAAILLGGPVAAEAAAPGWVGPAKVVLDPLLLYFEFAFLARIVLSWYPAVRRRYPGSCPVQHVACSVWSLAVHAKRDLHPKYIWRGEKDDGALGDTQGTRR